MPNETVVNVRVNPFTGVGDLQNSLVSGINSLITSFVPGFENYFVFVLAFIGAYLIKRRFKFNWLVTAFFVFVFWSTLRYWGIGG